jgi:hypothetical protein
VFLEVQNWYTSKNARLPQYTFSAMPIIPTSSPPDGQPVQQNGSNAIPLILPNIDSTVLPTIGLIVEF